MRDFTHLDIPADDWVAMSIDECAVAYHRFPHYGPAATPAEIAQYLGISVEHVDDIESQLRENYLDS